MNTEKDKFQFVSSSSDGVCITSVKVNDLKIHTGSQKDNPVFWLDGDQNECNENYMSTKQITIQNNRIISSQCKGEIDKA